MKHEVETKEICRIEGLPIVLRLKHQPPFSNARTEKLFSVVAGKQGVTFEDAPGLFAIIKKHTGSLPTEVCSRNADALAIVLSRLLSLGTYDDQRYARDMNNRRARVVGRELAEQLWRDEMTASYREGLLHFSVKRGDTLLMATFRDTYEFDPATFAIRQTSSVQLPVS